MRRECPPSDLPHIDVFLLHRVETPRNARGRDNGEASLELLSPSVYRTNV